MRPVDAIMGIFLSAVFVVSNSPAIFADTGIKTSLSIDIGWESLEYEEHEPVTETDSHARTDNAILRIEGIKRWRYSFVGLRAALPVVLGSDEERWLQSGSDYQTNALGYRWRRIDGYIGYPLHDLFNPYTGVRWSEGRQERDSFVVFGTPVSQSARELIRSWDILFGIRGYGSISGNWSFHYWLEYLYPVDVEVTNTTLPGFKATDREGYTIEFKSGIEYAITKAVSAGIVFYGGRMHWDGSTWLPYKGGLAKWPENDTDYLGGLLNIRWRF